ncbi:MAG: phosphatidylserine decarboxylase family protein [Bacteroidetes bacterium]|nr:phosphatidylserine decarboxylase family protein [Bacteroidota bacterium]MDA1119286.1 phosphatidylserine decarboxylase family protein [Bacteroidota bacterium]
MTIHKEGRKILVILLLLLFGINYLLIEIFAVAAIVFNSFLGCSVMLFLLVLQFFRNPKITPLIDSKFVLAPADGKVVVIEEVEEVEYFNNKRTQVSIFMSPVNVHVNRNPVSGIVSYFKYHPGKYLVAWHPKSSTQNERTTVVVKMSDNLEVLFRQIAGAVARRIKCYIKEGDVVVQGAEFGFIKFGSRVDILLPTDATICVNLGDKTQAGMTRIAELPG